MRHMVAAMGITQKRLGTLAVPLDRAIEFLGRPGQAHVLGVQINLGAKTAAHIGRNHTHLVFRQAHHERRHEQTLDVRVLVGHVQRVVVVGTAVAGDRRARLHRVGREAVIEQIDLRDMGCAREGGIHCTLVADRPLVAVVVRGGFMKPGRAGLHAVTHVHHGGQRCVIDHDQFGGVLGVFQRISHHHRHMVTHIAHLAQSQDRMRRLLHGLAGGVGDQPATRQAADLVGRHVVAIEHTDHTRRLECGGLVDLADAGVGMRRTHEHRVVHIGQHDVVGVLASAS